MKVHFYSPNIKANNMRSAAIVEGSRRNVYSRHVGMKTASKCVYYRFRRPKYATLETVCLIRATRLKFVRKQTYPFSEWTETKLHRIVIKLHNFMYCVHCQFSHRQFALNLLKPNDIYTCRTAALTSRRYILNIYSTNIHTEYFKHAA